VRTGILGGTFDPIHLAHLHAGETALHQAGLDRVLFVPAGDPWQKDDRDLSPAIHRVEMLRLAITGVVGFEVDEREVQRTGPTYTIDTLASFPDTEDLFLILGADAAARMPTWHRSEEVLARSQVLVAPRPGTSLEEVRPAVPGALILDMAALDVSATAIRALARKQAPYRFLVPPRVYEYIQSNRLYAETPEGDRVVASTDQEDPP
jgi:nicotinate-nucleotide adenylyltransferase